MSPANLKAKTLSPLILVVDDEALVRMTIADTLTERALRFSKQKMP